MGSELEFLEEFPKDSNGLYIVYELFTFDNLFQLLLKEGFDHEEALCFILGNCSLSAVPFQERIHNKRYKRLSAEDALDPYLAAHKARLLYHLMNLE